ncbi:hypothetical protein [Bacillus cereus]
MHNGIRMTTLVKRAMLVCAGVLFQDFISMAVLKNRMNLNFII